MARKTVFVSDIDNQPIEDGQGGKLRLTYEDARKSTVEWDVTGNETELQTILAKGRRVARRGRKPSNA